MSWNNLLGLLVDYLDIRLMFKVFNLTGHYLFQFDLSFNSSQKLLQVASFKLVSVLPTHPIGNFSARFVSRGELVHVVIQPLHILSHSCAFHHNCKIITFKE